MHIDMRQGTCFIEPCRTYDWVVSHVWLSHVAPMNESMASFPFTHTHICTLSFSPSLSLTHTHTLFLSLEHMHPHTHTHTHTRTHEHTHAYTRLSEVWAIDCVHSSASRSVPWLIQKSWLIQKCAMTHSGVCHDSFRSVPWRIQECDMTHLEVCHD